MCVECTSIIIPKIDIDDTYYAKPRLAPTSHACLSY